MPEQNFKKASSIPLTMTGAMRSSNEIGADGLSNLRSAIFVAMDEEKGGGKQLKQIGIVFAQGLSGVKARIKLLVILNS